MPVATTTVRLPGGWLDGDGGCHRDADLRPLCGDDEEWLHALPLSTPEASVVNELLARCLRRVGPARSTHAVARDLPAGDQEWLVLRLWQLTFGNRVELVLSCPGVACGARMDVDFALDELPAEERPQRAEYPLDGSRSFRLPRGSDLAARGRVSTVDRTAGELEAALLGRCLLGHDEETDAVSLLADDPELRAELAAAMHRHAVVVERDVEAACPECGHEFGIAFDPILLFLAEVFRGRAEFEHDLHLLGLYYHWPLREILAMSRPRRRHYVRLLRDKLAR